MVTSFFPQLGISETLAANCIMTPLQKRDFFARSRLSRDCAEAWQRHAAQGIPMTYADIAEKARFSSN
jgi:hypothetical protein